MNNSSLRSDRQSRLRETTSLDVDGTAVTCHLGGVQQEDGDPVVLLHGIGGSTILDFKFLFPMLARRHSILAVDFSPPALKEREPLQLEHLVRQVSAAIDELLPGRRVTIVGYSLGAVVAAAVAASHPAPARLVLASGWLQATTRHRMFNSIWQQLNCQDTTVLHHFARFSALSTSFVNNSAPEALQEIFPFSLSRFTDALVQLTTTVDLTDLVPLISVPTLVIGCSDDAIADRDQAQALVGAIHDARYAEIESGHAVVTERPAELLSLIDGFLHQPTRYPIGSIPPGIVV
jgi:pimeloyl-ACP methyl ester carboxylesterase